MTIHAHHLDSHSNNRGRGVPRQGRPPGVPDTPEARAHAQEAEELKQELRDLGVGFEQISPSSDNRGHGRFNFKQIRRMLEEIDSRDDEIDELYEKIEHLESTLRGLQDQLKPVPDPDED